MTTRSARPSRRTLLAAAGLSIPGLARAQTGAAMKRKGVPMHLRFVFADQDFTAILEDNPSAHDLAAMLPLELTIRDYSTNEKIAHLPRRLTEEGSGPFSSEAAGDLCYFAPWGNLAMFHGPYRWSQGLIRLGRFDGGGEPLLVRGAFPLTVSLLS